MESTISSALFWGALSAVSLPIGALLGIWLKPKQKINSAFMAFGAGALLFALTIELFGHVPHHVEGHGYTALYVSLGGALLGGLIFDFLNTILNDKGAFLRKISQAKNYVAALKYNRTKDLLKELSSVQVLQRLSPKHMAELVHTVKKESFEAGEVVFKQGDAAQDMYFVISGEVEIIVHNDENQEKKIATLGKNETFGELGILMNEPRTADAKALTVTRVYKVSKSNFMDIAKKDKNLAADLEQLANDRVNDLNVKTSKNSDHWQKEVLDEISSSEFSVTEEEIHQEGEAASGGSAAMAIWMGIFIDGIPESLIIGMMALSPGGMSMAFIAGVFLANLPEAMSSSVSMQKSGMSVKKILVMWGSLTVLTAIGAGLGATIFPANPEGNIFYFILGIEGLAAGAMLTMIAETMLPEAFEQGGRIIGFATLVGFLTALIVKVL
ncbi:MAG: cyclic nucleotide-binding domain-containing protein [Bdellovibrionaceae bacterium]|mgnify:CR=1 FL=1|jgi:CRP-like cAMP-binding protein|nr:cyclic nucleotide-binding domain-containing protein [Pseudobdellovibrionaceae bacterium]